MLGEFATSFFSSLMGVIGSAKLLQALARDNLIPGLSLFGEGSKKNDEPRYAILITHVVAQLTMLSDINQIASLVTMSYLMTFLVTNLACFTLKIGSAPNFRPSFHYFSWQSAAIGAIASAITMFYVDGVYASGCVAVLIAIFVIIHYTASPKTWGDVSQSLIYHQVRKYLLRLRSDNVKFWRPSVLLLINDPRRQYKLIQFCNSLKKGALFILAHVIVTDDYKGSVPEAKRQQASWAKYIDFSKIKGFINISVSPTAEWGIRNMVLSSGLGGMRPNIVVMGFFNLNDLRKSQPLIDIPSPQHSRPSSVRGVQDPKSTRNSHQKHGQALLQKLHGLSLPTDTNRSEGAISAKSYVTVLEDVLLRMRINVAIAKGFDSLELPGPAPTTVERVMSWLKADKVDDDSPTKYIDLWPVQMSAFAQIDSEGDEKRSILTTNFDTYTLILQLGCILATVSSWSRTFKLRVSVFVEYESDVAEERQRVESLLSNLRIKSEVRVFWLASGDLKTYEVIVNGKGTPELGEALEEVDAVLEDEEWWQEIKTARTEGLESETYRQLSEMSNSPSPGVDSDMLRGSFQSRPTKTSSTTVRGLQRIMRKAKRRVSVGPLNRFPAEMRLQLSSFDPNNLIQGHRTYSSSSDSSSSDDDFTDSDSDGRAASANDLETSSSDDERQMVHRSRSFHSFNRPRPSVRSPVSIGASASTGQARPIMVPSKAGASDSALKSQPSTGGPSKSAVNTLRRPPTIRHHSMPKFTSKPVPPTTISSEDGPGPSIMFTEQLPPSAMLSATQASSKNVQSKSSAEEFDVASANTAGGFPAQQALPLSFNDLPSRAQHLILNELMAHHSEQAAVLFTTLPSPVEGTCDSEVDSIRYLSDVEVLCVNLPPLLLVHSNTVTVTMSL